MGFLRALLRGRIREDRGVYAILFAIIIVVVFTMIAIVVDLSNVRASVRENSSNADFAALAAGTKLPGDPQGACLAAWQYIVANIPQLPSGAVPPGGAACAGFPSTPCTSATPATNYTATGTGGYVIIFRYPIPDGDPAMEGRLTPSYDGTDRCERMQISVRTNQSSLFGGIVGASGLSAPATAVVRGHVENQADVPVALLLLDPVGCPGLATNGGGGNNGGVKVFPSGSTPGFIAADSDGTDGSCAGNNTGAFVLDATGNPGRILACGPGSDPVANTCLPGGEIRVFAMDPGQTVCNTPDPNPCDPNDIPVQLNPQPIPLSKRLTRAPVDHRYNCQLVYPNYPRAPFPGAGVVPIGPCLDPVTTADPAVTAADDRDGDGYTSDYIDELTRFAGSFNDPIPAGFSAPPVPLSCTEGGTVVEPPGNWYINCPSNSGFQVKNSGDVTFQGGNIIFNTKDGVGVDIKNNFRMNTAPNGATIPAACLKNGDARPRKICPTNYSANASYIYVRGGGFNKSSAGGELRLRNTFMLLKNGPLTLNGGASILEWSAPGGITNNAGGPFEDIALWSESSASHSIQGSSSQNIEGSFFTPYTTFSYQGGGAQDQAKAQFLTWRMSAGGNGILKMSPDPDRITLFPVQGFQLIR